MMTSKELKVKRSKLSKNGKKQHSLPLHTQIYARTRANENIYINYCNSANQIYTDSQLPVQPKFIQPNRHVGHTYSTQFLKITCTHTAGNSTSH